MKNKKVLWIAIVGVDVALTIFLFVIHIIMITTLAQNQNGDLSKVGGLAGYLINNLNLYLGAFVIPTFVILAGNIVALVIYVRKQTKKEPISVNELTDEQKEELKKQLLDDISNGKQ